MNPSMLCRAPIFAVALISSAHTFSAGFQISEQSVTGLGRAFAGAGLSGEGISDQFFNPAGLDLSTGSELEVGVHFLETSARFENQGSTVTLASPSGSITFPAIGTNANGGDSAIVPNIYLAGDLNENLRYGLGINAPFGLVTDYDDSWVGRYAALKSELTTVEITPSVSYALGNNAVGVGLILLHADAKLTNAQFTGPATPDAHVRLEGNDTAVGYTMGIMGENNYGRIGLSLRSRMKIDINGSLSISPLGVSSGASASITLPRTIYLSGMLKAKPNLDFMGTLRFTDWEKFRELRVSFDNGMPDSVTPENWSSTIMTSIGVVYRSSDKWTWRGGIAYDEVAVDDTDRTARIPDADRYWLSLGGSYRVSRKMRVDLGYAHIFTDDVPLNQTTNLVATAPGTATSNLKGKYPDSDAYIFSIALSIALGKTGSL